MTFSFILLGENKLNSYSSIGYKEMKKGHQLSSSIGKPFTRPFSVLFWNFFFIFFSSPNFLGILLSSYFCVQILMRDSFYLHENFNGRSCLLFYFFFANFSFSTIYPLIFSGKRHAFHIVPFEKISFQLQDFVDNFTVIYCQYT